MSQGLKQINNKKNEIGQEIKNYSIIYNKEIK